ncbi:unnamed protein product [Lactuca saligna]|uniref:Uncharacterized protein n=1 Tax=Lactuca saligna TaxID=75948 RepID=A0AA35Z9B4_LACSI|nr:unnamed protein product [Lactuca saligna]
MCVNRKYPHLSVPHHPVSRWDPKAASLKIISLSFPDLCARLFYGNSVTCNFKCYSTQTSSGAGSSSCHVPLLEITGTFFVEINDDDDISHHASEPFCEPPPSATSPSGNPNKMAKLSTSRAPSDSPDETSITTSDDLAFEMKKALQHLTKGYTIPQCLEKLKFFS